MERTNLYSGRTLLYSFLFWVVFTVLSCTNVENKDTSNEAEAQQKELEEVTSKIKEQNSRFERFYLNGQADSLALVFGENVKQYISHQPPTNGLDELIKNNQLLMSWGTWEFEIATMEVKTSGQMAVERGKYKYTFTPNEASPITASVDSGNYVALWEEIDGKWKVVWDAPVTEIPFQ